MKGPVALRYSLVFYDTRIAAEFAAEAGRLEILQ